MGATAPALLTRARLSERRPAAVRRVTMRVSSRVGILLLADLLAFLAARQLLRGLVLNDALGKVLPSELGSAGPMAAPGQPGSMVFPLMLLAALALTGLYGRHRRLNMALRVALAVCLAVAAATVPLAAVVGVRMALAATLIMGVMSWSLLMVARAAAEWIVVRVWPRDRGAAPAILVGPAEAFASVAATAIGGPGGDYRITERHALPAGSVEPAALANELAAKIEACDAEAVVLCDALPERHVRALLEVALATGCQLLYPARAIRIPEMRPRLVWHHNQPFFELGAPVLKPGAVAVKLVADGIGSAALLLLASPLMLLIAIAIKLGSAGPVFFSQDRAGLGGRRFRMLKFRTMRDGADSEKDGLAHLNESGDARLFKIRGDPRVTRFGRFLRRWSLDELPQLWNVLRGDMSLVGPRPFFESDFSAYEDHHFRRLDTKPGITGLWQVSGRSDVVDFEDVIFLDRQYIEQWSFWLDLSILFRTVPTVIRRTGAY